MTDAARRVVGPIARRCALIMLLGALRLPHGVRAQDTVAVPAVVAVDTTLRVKPFAAFWRSLLVPGWGQAKLGRHVTGAAFVTWEGVTIMMTLKAQQEVHYLQESGSGDLSAKRQEVQDWMVLWIFNHLFAGAEAFVSAHLQDFPKDLHLEVVPRGFGVVVPFAIPHP